MELFRINNQSAYFLKLLRNFIEYPKNLTTRDTIDYNRNTHPFLTSSNKLLT